TFSTSYQVRATVEPTSGLFWWSAETTSTFIPFLAAPKSSTAMRAASTEPGPPMSAYRPDMSFITPSLITPSEICACAAPLDNSVAAAVASSCFVIVFISSSPSGCQRGKTHDGVDLNAEVLIQHAHLAVEFGGGEALDDAAVFH